MLIVLGALIGYACGWAVWLVSRHFAPIYQTAVVVEGTASSVPTTSATWAGVSLAALLQLLMSGWGAYVGWQGSSPTVMLLIIAITAVLLAITVIDLQTRHIPNVLILTVLFLAGLQVLMLSNPTLRAAIFGILACGGLFLLVAIAGRGAMGMGDVKLAAAIGALLGFPTGLQGLFLGIVFGGAAALYLLLTKRAGRKDSFAYGPWLALGAWIVLVQAWGLWAI